MRGASRESLAAGAEALESALAARSADADRIGDGLFAVTGALDSSAGLRRALTDPSRPAESRVQLLRSLVGSKVDDAVLEVVSALVRGRWSAGRDLGDACEELAVTAVVAAAERAGTLESLEDDLFRFGRIVAGNPALRDALTDRTSPLDSRRTLVESLLDGKVAAQSLRLVVQAVTAARGQRLDDVLDLYVRLAARRREQLVAHVVTAVALSAQQRGRLASALGRQYGRDVRLNLDVDPGVLGGVQVRLGDDLVEGTVAARLERARRQLGG